jgi:DNA-directed RNA polymerase specialized sigma24 family protein
MNPRLPQSVARLPERVRTAAAIEALAPRERAVLALMLIEGLDPGQAAGALGTSASQVQRLYTAALASVARELGPDVRRAA